MKSKDQQLLEEAYGEVNKANLTTTEYLVNCLDEAHGSLVAAAKIAHLEKHPEAVAISKLIDTLEDILVNI